MMELPTKAQVTIRIIGIVSASGFLILAILSKASLQLSFFQDAVLNIFSLVILATPVIYFWVVKPFVKAHNHAIDQIQQLSWIDPLTQLANRRLILRHMEKTLSSAVRHKVYGAVMMIDLDDFKPINDIHGHEAGDAILTEIAKRLVSITRTEDIVGRLGGDEFIVILGDLNTDKQHALDRAELVANRLIQTINKPLDFNGKQLKVSASIGIRFLDYEKIATVDQLFSNADSAMYLAKNNGKGNAAFFQEEIN
jgi:diguanylate cyclase (GGDEF)-like protein